MRLRSGDPRLHHTLTAPVRSRTACERVHRHAGDENEWPRIVARATSNGLYSATAHNESHHHRTELESSGEHSGNLQNNAKVEKLMMRSFVDVSTTREQSPVLPASALLGARLG